MSDVTVADVLYELDDEDMPIEPQLEEAYDAVQAAVRSLLKLEAWEMRGLLVGRTFRLTTLLSIAVECGWDAAIAAHGRASDAVPGGGG